MIVGILDDGVSEENVSTPITHYTVFSEMKEIEKESHGTICAKIIETYGQVDRIIDVRFLNHESKGTIEDLCKGLNMFTTINVDVINLSSGIEKYLLIHLASHGRLVF